MGGYYGNTASVPRPAPANWWEQQQQNAEDQWGVQGQAVATDVADARGARTTAAKGADTALSSFGGLTDPNVTGWSPNNTKSTNPNAVAQWMTSLNGLKAQQGPAGFTSAFGGVKNAMLPGDGSHALTAFDANDVQSFDPSAAGQTFAKGAQGIFDQNLTSRLATLQNSAVGAGRLRTGFYDRDQGSVATQLGKDFNSQIAQESGVFSGQRLDALKSAAGLRLARAQGIDANTLRSGEDTNQFALSQAGGLDSGALTSRGQDIGYKENLNAFGLDQSRMGLSGSEFSDTQAADRARFLDTTGFDRAKYLDTAATGRATTGLEAALAREGRYMADYNTQAGRKDEYTSASRDWAASDRAAQDTRDAIARAQGRGASGQVGTFGGGRTGPGSTNPYAGTELAGYWRG